METNFKNNYDEVVLENEQLKSTISRLVKENKLILKVVLLGIIAFIAPLLYFVLKETEEGLLDLDKIGIPLVLAIVITLVFIIVRANNSNGANYSIHK